ncbi:MAG: hypothetical protein ACRDOO_14225, partial [Actinomadura sp.]
MTEVGTVMGSPGWIAPERLRGVPAGPAADVFCWGLLVSYAATGRHPFGSGELGKRPDRILTLAPDLAGLTEPLRSLVGVALVKDPAARPEAADLRHSLMAPRAEPTVALAIEHLWSPSVLPSKPRSRQNHWQPSELVNRRTAGLLTTAAAAVLAAVLLVPVADRPPGPLPRSPSFWAGQPRDRPTRPPTTRRGGRLADWWTLLHPPYTAWHLSYVLIG